MPETASQPPRLIEPLASIAANPRVRIRRGGVPRPGGKCVVYWMQRAQRAHENPALETAVACANALGLPLVVWFSAIHNFPRANLRHYHFLQQGMRDVAEALAERGIGFVIRRPIDGESHKLEAFLEEVQAAMVVGDENPLRDLEKWRSAFARKTKLPYITVDADVVVPSAIFDRTFTLLHHFRPKLRAQLDTFLVPIEKHPVQHPWKKKLPTWPLAEDVTEGFPNFDRTVQPVEGFHGGSKAALKRLHEFTTRRLATYDSDRNHPELAGTSELSPYLHFGHIGPITIALAVQDAVANGHAHKDQAEKYLDELIGWRELSVLFVKHNPDTYDTWECAEPWAHKSLREHARDVRPYTYTLKQLEKAETHDELWNAAQRQMAREGWMHNYMRMYWGKKILEWSPNPAKAFEWAVLLNDKYELDGRDPNSYSGIAWAIVGKHDRPWFDRPIFGQIRYMSGQSTGKKFDSARYISLYPA
jgi:deoxyribodipyrimidine photo-lyase